MNLKTNEWKLLNFSDAIDNISTPNKIKIPKKNYNENGKYPIIDQGNKFISGYSTDKHKIFSENLPVIIFGDHTRILKYIDFPFSLGADGTKIIVPKKELFCTKYFYYYLKSITIEDHGYNRHFKYLKNIKIPAPQLKIQKQIVTILEKAEKLKEHRQIADDLSNSYLKSIFFEMFGDPVKNSKNWEVGYLNQLVKMDTKSIKPLDFPNGIYIGLEHIESKTGKILESNSIENVDIKSNKYSFNENHVLYGKLRPYLNKVSLPNFNGVCSTDIIPILPINNMSNKIFIKYLLSLDYYVNLATEQSTGANLPRISPKKLEKFKVPLPPIELQNKFAEIVKRIEKIKEYQNQSKIEINNLFDNLMQKAFKGE